jgi:hypothetical protein
MRVEVFNPLQLQDCNDIPMPIVKLNRWTLMIGVLVGFALQQPLVTTLLFLILLPAVLFGQKRSLIFQIGKRLFARQNLTAEREDRRLMRFNNSIALILFGVAQVAFLTGFTILGWVFSLMVATAAGVALVGFCVGCFLYYQFKLNRYRLLGGR